MSKYWVLVATTPDLAVLVDKYRVDDYKLVKVEEILLSCHPVTYLCKGHAGCSCFLKYYYYYSKVKNDYQAKVFTFKFCLKRPHKSFPLKKLLSNTTTTRCYAVHCFPKRITEEEYYK